MTPLLFLSQISWLNPAYRTQANFPINTNLVFGLKPQGVTTQTGIRVVADWMAAKPTLFVGEQRASWFWG